ncbi:MAG: hypothetical protein DLM71_03565 [Chloroflexi bacterium]|nr:MAG: hypothetical protein DLM71_03565 [Chloroflexota bacterium]
MDVLALCLAAAALLLSMVAVLLAVGVTLRVSHMEGHGAPTPSAGLAVGSEIPRPFVASLPPGSDIEAWLEGPSLIVFAAANCQPCRELMASISDTDLHLFGNRVAIIERPGPDGSPLTDSVRCEADYVTDPDGGLAKAFETNVTPHSFAILGGRIAAQTIGAEVTQLAAIIRTGAATS